MRTILLLLLTGLVSACAANQSGGASDPLAREEHACADVGIAPGSGNFRRCTIRLDEAESARENSRL